MTVVRTGHERGITTLTLDSPATRNALSAVLVGELADALTRCGKDADVRAVVLTHTGNTFCAGADLRDPPPPDAFVGLLRMHGLGHLVRAVIEGALLNMREILEIFTAHGIRCERIVASGGATRDPFWLQTMADVFGTEVVTMTGSSEGGAYGAALVAGVGAGTWTSFDDVYDTLEVSARFLPDSATAQRYTRIYSGYRKLFGHLGDVYGDIATARGDG